MKDLPLVVCTWEDAWTDADTSISVEDVLTHHAPTIVTTIGWLLHQDDVGVSLANEKHEGYYRGRTFILAKNIISLTPYKLTKPRKPRVPAPDSKP